MNYSRELHSMQCPKCKHGMEKASYQDVTVDRCTYCEGLWFDEDKAQRLKRIVGSEVLDTGNPAKGRKYDSIGVINCPRCGQTMERESDWKQTHIWYETCRSHGIFMDAGEFKDYKHETLIDLFRDWIKGERPTS